MALLTRRAMESALRRVWDTGGLTPDMENDLKRLQDDFDEREGILRKYGEVYDGEDKDEYDWVETRTAAEAQSTNWEERYSQLKQQYMDRFFGSNRITDADTVIEDATAATTTTDVPLDDILYRREG